MSVTTEIGCEIKDINESIILDNKSSLTPVTEIKEEPGIVSQEEESPTKKIPKRKCVRRLKADVFADEDPKPKRKYVRKPKIESPIIPNANNSVLDISSTNQSIEFLNSSINNADSSMEKIDTVVENKPKGKKTWSRRKKVNTDNSCDNISNVTMSPQIPPSVPGSSTEIPELERIPENQQKIVVEVKQKGRRKRIIEAVILDTSQKMPVDSKIQVTPEGQSVMHSQSTPQHPVPTALNKPASDILSQDKKLENWKPKRIAHQRATKLLLFSEMPVMPLDDKQRKEVNSKNKRRSKAVEVEKEFVEVETKKEISPSQMLEVSADDKEKKNITARKRRVSKPVEVKMEIEEKQSEILQISKVKQEIQNVKQSEFLQLPNDNGKEVLLNSEDKQESQEVEEEIEKTPELIQSEIPELRIAKEENEVASTKNKRKRKEVEVKKEDSEMNVVEVEMLESRRKSNQNSDSANLNSGASEIDGDELESEFLGNESSSEQIMPLTPTVEKNVVTAIDQVAKGEGEINPNPVAFPRRLSTRTRIARKTYVTPTHSPVKRRTSKRKSQEFLSQRQSQEFVTRRKSQEFVPRRKSQEFVPRRNSQEFLIDIQANKRLATFQDSNYEYCSVPATEIPERVEEHSSSEEEEPIIYNSVTCSVCRWKIRPDLNKESDLENIPRRKNHKFTYTIEEKNQLYADGQFLMDEYEIEKNREDQVLWRIIDSCSSVQRFDPYEANGRVFHHGTDHYHHFLEKDWEFYQRFQPIYAVPILENDNYQMALFISVDRLLPSLAMISKTDELFDAYKVVIQMIISANLERNFIQHQLTAEDGDIYFSANWEKISAAINCRVKEIMNSDYWAQGTFNLLTNFPRLIYSRIVTDEKIVCTTCLNRDRKAVFNIKINGTPYNPETFEPLPVPGIPICQICYYCQPLIKSFIRLYHHRYLLFGCVQKNISHLLSELQENEKCEPFQLLENMMDDHEWILHLFLEFQVVLADADRSISQIVSDPNKPTRKYSRKAKK